MADDVSKSAEWAKKLAVVTLVCLGVIVASLIFAFSRPSSESGLAVLIMVVGPAVLIFGSTGLLASIAGTILGTRACTRADCRSPITILATVFHTLVVVGMVAYMIAYIIDIAG